MIARTLLPLVALLAAVGGLAFVVLSGGGGKTTGAEAGLTRTDERGQVTVSVTWNGDRRAPRFEVKLDTHSVDLDSIDLGRLAAIRLSGGTVEPASWDAPKGGHHRKGNLSFGSFAGALPAGYLELVIRDVAGIPERTFRWDLE